MVDLRSKRCLHRGCSKVPSFGVDGSNRSEFCSEHKRDWMVVVQRNSLSSVGTKASSGRRWGGALVAGDTPPVRRSDSGKQGREWSTSIPPTSRGTGKRARQNPTGAQETPTQVEPAEHEGPVQTEDGPSSESADAAVKTEPEPFSIGRRGGWRR